MARPGLNGSIKEPMPRHREKGPLDCHLKRPKSLGFRQIDSAIFLPGPYWGFEKDKPCATDRLVGLFQDHCFTVCWFIAKLGGLELRIHPRCDILQQSDVIRLCTNDGRGLADVSPSMEPGYHRWSDDQWYRLSGLNAGTLCRKIAKRLFGVWAEHCVENTGILNGRCWLKHKKELQGILLNTITRSRIN